MKVIKKIHPGYIEFEKSTMLNVFGKHQYIYSSEKGSISLIELIDYMKDGVDLWEIYSLEGSLFNDIERFKSKEEAEKQIKIYMGEK